MLADATADRLAALKRATEAEDQVLDLKAQLQGAAVSMDQLLQQYTQAQARARELELENNDMRREVEDSNARAHQAESRLRQSLSNVETSTAEHQNEVHSCLQGCVLTIRQLLPLQSVALCEAPLTRVTGNGLRHCT